LLVRPAQVRGSHRGSYSNSNNYQVTVDRSTLVVWFSD